MLLQLFHLVVAFERLQNVLQSSQHVPVNCDSNQNYHHLETILELGASRDVSVPHLRKSSNNPVEAGDIETRVV